MGVLMYSGLLELGTHKPWVAGSNVVIWKLIEMCQCNFTGYLCNIV